MSVHIIAYWHVFSVNFFCNSKNNWKRLSVIYFLSFFSAKPAECHTIDHNAIVRFNYVPRCSLCAHGYIMDADTKEAECLSKSVEVFHLRYIYNGHWDWELYHFNLTSIDLKGECIIKIHTIKQGLNLGRKCYRTAGPLPENFYRSSWILTGPSSAASNNNNYPHKIPCITSTHV